MVNTFKYLVLALVRDKGIMVWALAFPIILSTCFIFMFAGLDAVGQTEPVRTVVVQDDAYEADDAFRVFIEGLSSDADGEEPLLAVDFASSREAALEQMDASADSDDPIEGVLMVGDDGLPEVLMNAASPNADPQMGNVYQSILLTVADSYASRHRFLDSLIEDNPQALGNQAVIDALTAVEPLTEKVSVTQNAPKESVRYYFALLGFAAMMGAQSSLIAVLWLLPRTSALGARRSIGGTSRLSSLMGTLAACWAVSFFCLVVAYLFMRFVAGVDFAGRDLPCLVALAASSLMATALGAAIAVLPRIGTGAKSGLLTAVVCIAALFAGLYGQPTMELADTVAAACPASQWVNPAVQVSQAMFSLMYYDTPVPFLTHIAVLVIMAVLLFACSAAALRRQRYASL